MRFKVLLSITLRLIALLSKQDPPPSPSPQLLEAGLLETQHCFLYHLCLRLKQSLCFCSSLSFIWPFIAFKTFFFLARLIVFNYFSLTPKRIFLVCFLAKTSGIKTLFCLEIFFRAARLFKASRTTLCGVFFPRLSCFNSSTM